MTVCRRCFVSAVIVGGSLTAFGDVPTYEEPELQCRSNFSGAFNLPNAAFFTNSTSSVNDLGEVAIEIGVIGGSNSQGVWFGSEGAGSIVYQSQPGASFSDVSLNNAGRIVTTQIFSSPEGVFFYDTSDSSSGLLTTLPFGASGWSTPQINDAGQLGFRAIFSGRNAWASVEGNASAIHASEVDLDPQSPYSFLFTPAFNNSRQIAGKVRLGPAGQFGEDRPDQIVLTDADGSVQIIAEDQDSDPESSFTRFNNSVAVTDDGRVAFIAGLAKGGRGLYLSDGTTTVEIANTNSDPIDDIDFFSPAVNNAGVVVFRAFDATGRAIYVGDGDTLVRLVGEHDLVMTDLGMGRIDQNDNSPVLGGSPSINNNGDVAFQATLTPPDNNQIEWGSGVFLARAAVELLGDMNCDGQLSVGDINPFVLALTDPPGYAKQFPDCPITNGDINDDGSVSVGDINGFVALIVGG